MAASSVLPKAAFVALAGAMLAFSTVLVVADGAQAAPCHPSIDGGVTCQVTVAGCTAGAHVRDYGEISPDLVTASAEC